MITSKHDPEARLAELKRQVPTRGWERHPIVFGCVAGLPEELRSPTISALVPLESLKEIIYFPPQIQRGRHYVPKQALLFTPEGVMHVLASIWPDEEPRITCVSAGALMYMKISLVLLYGLLELVARGPDGPVRLAMEFNTVAWAQLAHPLRRLLEAAPCGTREAMTCPLSVQQAREALPLKFANGLRIYGLLPGENLQELVFQRGDWQRWLYLFRRPTVSDTLLLLSTNYMVVIQEELDTAQGWLVSYIPRNSIVRVCSRPAGRWNELTVDLKRGDQAAEYELLVREQAAQAWRARWIQHGGRWQDLPAGRG